MSRETVRTDGIDKVLVTLDRLLDSLERQPDDWENPTLAQYLEAMRAWLHDSQRKPPRDPSWQLISDLLEAAKIYE